MEGEDGGAESYLVSISTNQKDAIVFAYVCIRCEFVSTSLILQSHESKQISTHHGIAYDARQYILLLPFSLSFCLHWPFLPSTKMIGRFPLFLPLPRASYASSLRARCVSALRMQPRGTQVLAKGLNTAPGQSRSHVAQF